MSDNEDPRTHQRWAHLRFSIVGPLLAAPPCHGQLQAELERLAAKHWLHPITGQPTRFGVSTIQRWYYTARSEKLDPVGVLCRKIRNDAGRQSSLNTGLRQILEAQYDAHKRWSRQLHYDNLRVVVTDNPACGPLPSYSTILRYMNAHGLARKILCSKKTPGVERAEARLQAREVRSFESGYVHGLWHLDWHHGSLKILVQDEWVRRPCCWRSWTITRA